MPNFCEAKIRHLFSKIPANTSKLTHDIILIMFNIFKKSTKPTTEPTAYVFIGRSGAGKGTQVELFMEEFARQSSNKLLHVETGNLLREFIKGPLYIQKRAKEVLDIGGLMPESVAIDMWMNYLITNFTGKESLIFDGTPRKLVEAHLLDDALKFFKIPKYKVIYINATPEGCTERLLGRQRSDDTKDAIAKRMEWFDREVLPCIEFFKQDKDCVVLDINGEQTIEKVHADIMKAVFA